MANEFIARKGLIVSGSTKITGSLSVTSNQTINGRINLGTVPATSSRLTLADVDSAGIDAGIQLFPNTLGYSTAWIQNFYGYLRLSTNAYNANIGGTGIVRKSTSLPVTVLTFEDGVRILTAPTGGTADNFAPTTERFTVLNAGNVGINKSTPVYTLDVNGTGNFSQNLSVTGSIHGTSFTSSTAGVGFLGTSSFATSATTSSYPFNVSGPTIDAAGPTIFATFNATNSNLTGSFLVGVLAGLNTSTAPRLIAIGNQAGLNATNANDSIFLGQYAGDSATNASNSFFMGRYAGSNSTANYSIVIGAEAGQFLTNATNVIALGRGAGNSASNAAYSTFIGQDAGRRTTGRGSLGSFNIIIGTNISLPDNRTRSINLGGVIFATGSYNNTAGAPFTSSVDGARVGIGIVDPATTLHVNGNVSASFFKGDGSQITNVTGSIPFNIERNTFTGDGSTTSFTMTRPYNINSILVSVDGLTYIRIEDYTVSDVYLQFVTAPPSQSNVLVTAFVNALVGASGSFSGSFLGSIESASYAQTSSFALKVAVYTGSVAIGTAAYTGSFTGSLLGTSSFASTSSLSLNSSVTVSDTAPVYPSTNQLWYDSTAGKTYIWYTSGSYSQWVLQSDPTYDIGAVVQAASSSIAFSIPNYAPTTPITGSIYFSSSFLYVYNGTKYVSASLN